MFQQLSGAFWDIDVTQIDANLVGGSGASCDIEKRLRRVRQTSGQALVKHDRQ